MSFGTNIPGKTNPMDGTVAVAPEGNVIKKKKNTRNCLNWEILWVKENHNI